MVEKRKTKKIEGVTKSSSGDKHTKVTEVWVLLSLLAIILLAFGGYTLATFSSDNSNEKLYYGIFLITFAVVTIFLIVGDWEEHKKSGTQAFKTLLEIKNNAFGFYVFFYIVGLFFIGFLLFFMYTSISGNGIGDINSGDQTKQGKIRHCPPGTSHGFEPPAPEDII